MTTCRLSDGTIVEIEHSEREPGTPAGGQSVKRTSCPDLDPTWPDVIGQPRGPHLCILYPQCACGREDMAGGQTVGALHLWVRYDGGAWKCPDGFTSLAKLMHVVQACATVHALMRDVLCPGEVSAVRFWRRALADECVVDAAMCRRKQYPDTWWLAVRVDGGEWQEVRYRDERLLMDDLEACESREWVEALVIGKGR